MHLSTCIEVPAVFSDWNYELISLHALGFLSFFFLQKFYLRRSMQCPDAEPTSPLTSGCFKGEDWVGSDGDDDVEEMSMMVR